MRSSMVCRVWLQTILLMTALIAVGCGKEPDAPKAAAPPLAGDSDKDKSKDRDKTQPARPAKADFAFTSIDFGKEYNAGHARAVDVGGPNPAVAKYKDKWIELAGEITYVARLPRPNITLEG